MKEHLQWLGLKVQDKITRFTGIVTTISFDLYGCVQAIVSPPVDEKGSIPEARWFDVGRLLVIYYVPVMAVPSFDAADSSSLPGGDIKPAFDQKPQP